MNGYRLQRRRQPLIWNFDPISLQLIDTYDHDIEMSITAMIYAMGGISPAGNAHQNTPLNFAGSMVSIDNGTPGTFAIYELLEGTYDARGKVSSVQSLNSSDLQSVWARKLILKNPYLTSADFGSLDYTSDAFSSVSLQISYDSYDIEHIVDRHNFDPSQFSAHSIGELRRNQRQVRGNLRRDAQAGGSTPGEIGSLMTSVRQAHREDRQEFRNEQGVIPGWTNH